MTAPEIATIHWTDYATAVGTVGAVVIALGLALRDTARRRADRLEQRELWARQVAITARVIAPLTVEVTMTNLGPSVVYNVMVKVFTDTGADEATIGARRAFPQLGVGPVPPTQLNWKYDTPVTNARIEFTDLYGDRWFRTEQGEFGRVSA